MRHTTIAMAGLVLAMAGAGCGGGGDKIEAPSTQTFARTWHLTKCEYVNVANTSQKVDLIASGWVIDLIVSDNMTYLFSATPPGGTVHTSGGTWSVSGSMVNFTPDGSSYSWQFTAQVTETTMTLSGADAEYDFNNDGTPDAAIWSMAGHT